MKHSSFSLIIPAAGSGRRMGTDIPKPYLDLNGATVLERTLSCFLGVRGLEQVVVATSPQYYEQTEGLLQALFRDLDTLVVEGGDRRQDSILNALMNVKSSSELVAVHDAVRPFITHEVIQKCLSAASATGGAIVGVPVKDTIKQVGAGREIESTPDRATLWQAQTPQIFKRDQFLKAYEVANQKRVAVTDDASLFEAAGLSVKIVEGERDNFKLTYPIDFKIAEMLAETFRPGGAQ